MSVKQKTNITVLAKFGIISTKTLDLLKTALSCNTMGANYVTYKRVRLVQEVQEPEERVHVEVEGDDDVVRLFRPQRHRSPRNCSPKGYHCKLAMLQGMSTSTSTLLQILGRLISRIKRIRRDR